MKKLFISSAALLFFVLVFSGNVFSQPDPDQRPRRERIHQRLNLTDAQETKIETLRAEHQKKMIDLKADLQKAQIDTREKRNGVDLSRSEVTASVEKINKIKNEMALTAANHRMDVYEILTPEQREIWKEKPGPRLDGKGQFRGKGNMRGDRMQLRKHLCW